jgi:hypothetical protein
MVMMIAEMQVGHNRAGGGDVHQEAGSNTGLLGANYRIENGRYRLTKVYTGETWNPFLKAVLATPGNNARAGEYILAIDGQELTAVDNIFERLQGTKGKQTNPALMDGGVLTVPYVRFFDTQPLDDRERGRCARLGGRAGSDRHQQRSRLAARGGDRGRDVAVEDAPEPGAANGTGHYRRSWGSELDWQSPRTDRTSIQWAMTT